MGHGHHHESDSLSDGRLVIAVFVNVLLTVTQLVGGVISGSLALIADALHNLNDAATLALALVARHIARKPADRRRTFGYRRAEVIGALINTTTLILVAIYLVWEAIARWFSPVPVAGWIVVIVATVALIVDLITALLTWAMAKHSLNIRAAFVHNVADALGSVAVIITGTLIILFDLQIADVIATLLIAAYILWQSVDLMRQSIRILMQSVPPGLDIEDVVTAMEAVHGVQSIHHLHVWQMDEHSNSLEVHVVVNEEDLREIERIKSDLKAKLAEKFEVEHSTLEIEMANEEGGCPCGESKMIVDH